MSRPRQLPHRPEAEAAVLGGIMLGGREALAEVAMVLRADDFYLPRSQAMFRAMESLDGRGEPIDVITIEAQLRRTGELELVGGIEGLAKFDRYATAHNIKAHAELVLEAARVRNLVVVAKEIAEEGMEELEDPAAFVDAAESRVFAVNNSRRLRGPRHVAHGMLDVFEDITARQRNGGALTGVPTGFFQMDEMTAGLQPSDLIILAARPSMGKTAFALNLAAHASISSQRDVLEIKAAAKGGQMAEAYAALVREGRIRRRTPTCFFSFEMSEAQLIERVLCSEARVDYAAVRRGGRMMEQDFRGLIASADRISAHSDLYIDDRPALSITEIRSASRLWARRLEPVDHVKPEGPLNGLIMVDYLQLARGSKAKPDSREQEISEISRGLKALAKELKVPVIALSQLNRAVDSRADHRPQLSDLRESGAIEQDADVIMFIYREERYLSADAPEEKRREVENKAEVIIGKQRNGPIGTVHLTFVKKHTRFENPAMEAHGYG